MNYWNLLDMQPRAKKTTAPDNTQDSILQKLMHNPLQTFNQLWNKEGPSNKFAYHVHVLERKGLLAKREQRYFLSSQGKKEVAYLKSKTGKRLQPPIVAVAIVVKRGNKYLMQQRTQEPFFGYCGFPSSKLGCEQYIYECAATTLEEETGLHCDLQLRGLFSSKTFASDQMLYNHQLFVLVGTSPMGEFRASSEKGDNVWLTKSQLKQENILPNILSLIGIAEGKTFTWMEADRFEENNIVKSMKVKRKETF